MAAEELVERVFARHIEGQPGVTPAARPTSDAARRRCRKVTQMAASRSPTSMPSSRALVAPPPADRPGQAPLDLTTLRGGVARAVGRDPGGQVGPAGASGAAA